MYKILIVEDEKWIREGLIAMIDSNILPIAYIESAENAEEARQLFVLHKPDIVISDVRLPACLGTDLCKELFSINPFTKFIMATGYDDFSYVRDALTYKAVDYLIKPITKEALHKALRLAVTEIEQERLQSLSNFEVLLISSLCATFYNSQNIEVLTQLETPFTKFLSGQNGYLIISVVYKKSTLYSYGFDFSLDSNWISITVASNTKLFLYRFACNENLVHVDQVAARLSHKINEVYRVLAGKDYCLILGKPKLYFAHLAEAFSEIKALLMAREEGDTYVLEPSPHKGICKQIILDDFDYFLSLAANLDLKKLEKHLHDKKDALYQKKVIIFELWETLYFMEKQIEHLFPELNHHQRQELNLKYEEQKYAFDMEELFEFSIEIIASIIRLQLKNLDFTDISHNLPWIITWLNQNYSRPLSLTKLAEVLFVSEAYLSSYFKKNTGESFTNYLTKLRIDQSKELLRKTDMKIGDIAQAVGYQDQHYFNRTFRKLCKTTPGDFRQEHKDVKD